LFLNYNMFFECKICGYFTNDNHGIHKCIDAKQFKIEKFKRCLKSINISKKKTKKMN
jgi:hypothetical protein